MNSSVSTCESVSNTVYPGGGVAVSADAAVSQPYFLQLEEAEVSSSRRRCCSVGGKK